MSDSKKCNKCGIEKSLEEFYKDKSKKDGYRASCKECVKKYYQENKEHIKERDKKYYQENKEKVKEYTEKIKENRNIRLKERYNNDPLFKLTQTLRRRMQIAIKEGQGFKCGSSQELLGCTFEEVREHLESKFKDGMTWENHGIHGWHIDHRRPCASFDLTKEDQQRECFHYTNLQPLWATENLSKSDKWEEEVSMEDLFE
jgi:hypothetical protein